MMQVGFRKPGGSGFGGSASESRGVVHGGAKRACGRKMRKGRKRGVEDGWMIDVAKLPRVYGG